MNGLGGSSTTLPAPEQAKKKQDFAILGVGLFLIFMLWPAIALSTALPVVGLVLAVALLASLRWARDDRLKPLRVIVVIAAVAAMVLAGYGLIT